jgi:hypothetical protein
MHGMISGRTPSGNAGMLVADEARLAGMAFAFDAEQQTWRKAPGESKVWVGYWNEARPGTTDLRRKKMRRGSPLKLGDGQEWLVPQLMLYAGESGFSIDLPCAAELDDNGKWTAGAALKEGEARAKLADRLYAGMVLASLGKSDPLTDEELLDITCDLLGMNYVVDRLEVAMLGLLSFGEKLADAAKIATDWQTAIDWLEKKSASVSAG